MKVSGNVFKFGDNIDTDVIIPARYLTSADPDHLKEHCMEDIDKSFKDRVKPGDIIVAGRNFGCGSSREHAPVAIKASGVSLVIASDFARLFYRNSINVGLPIMECPEAFETISDKTTGESFQSKPFPEFIKKIMACGGLLGYTESELKD